MPLPMEQDEPSDPIDVGLLGADAVVHVGRQGRECETQRQEIVPIRSARRGRNHQGRRKENLGKATRGQW
jgi:hypothetical protein